MGAASLASAQNPNPIRVNQVGYYPHAEKTAVIESDGWAKKYVIKDVVTGKNVWKGKAVRTATSPWSGKERAIIDFSDITKQGTYILTNGKDSEPIVINETTYPDLYNPIYSKLIAISDLYFFYTSSIKEIPIFSNLLAVFGMLLKTEYEQDILVSQNDKQRDIYIKFKGLTERLSLHYADNISMEEAANYVGYSKFHFARLFKEYSGMTYYDYQTSLKIKAVVEMLSETDLQISEIALRCGFNNLTSLSRNFKKQYGCSPSTYRHKLRRKKDL